MANKQHLAAVLYDKENLQLVNVPTHPPGIGEVRVQVHATGLCGSDWHYYAEGHNGGFLLQQPIILGHESAGTVVAIGPNLQKGIRPGDRVTIEPGIPCDECSLCVEGRYNLCESLKFPSSCKLFPHVNGTLQTLFNHPEKWVYKIPDSMSFEEAALCEPLSVALQACQRTRMDSSSDKHILILGAGAIGLLIGAVAKARGVHVTMIDVSSSRLEFAREYCADRIIIEEIYSGDWIYKAKKSIERLTQLKPPIEPADIIFECTGVPECLQVAIHLAKPGKRVGIIGIGNPRHTFEIGEAALREVDLIGVFRYANQYPKAIEMISSGQVDVKRLITSRFPLENTKEAFQALKGGRAIKVIVTN